MPVILTCPSCGKSRSVKPSVASLRKSPLCLPCSSRNNAAAHCNSSEGKKNRAHGTASPLYRTGSTNKDGYRICSLDLTHPFRAMADKYGRIREHRLLVAESLGRLLENWEVVHHKNQNRSDNRLENLELLSTPTHVLVTRMEQEIVALKKENSELRHALQDHEAQTV